MDRRKVEEKIKLLEELGVHLKANDVIKLKECKNEIQLDNVAQSLFMK